MASVAPDALTLVAKTRSASSCYIQFMTLTINGQPREFAALATLEDLIAELGLKQDRVAVEHNREIVPRAQWPATPLADGDRLEIVHFVGGGV